MSTTTTTIYPQDIECIFNPTTPTSGGIYISNLQAAQNPKTLNKHHIKAIITAASGACLKHPRPEVPYYKYIPGEDHSGFDLARYFEECVEFMEDSLKRTNVLVHCMAGISRSVTIAIAFFIKKRNMGFEEAYAMVKKRRKIIQPNDGFIRQLKEYERKHQIQRRQSLSKSKQNTLATTTPRYRTPENRTPQHSTAKSSQIFDKFSNFNFTEKTKLNLNLTLNSTQKVTQKQVKKTTITEMSDPQIDKKIAELRKKYALPEKNRRMSSGTIKHIKAPLAASDNNQTIGSLKSSWMDFKDLSRETKNSSKFFRLKTTNRENTTQDQQSIYLDLFNKSPQKFNKTANIKIPTKSFYQTRHFDSGVGIGLPIRKQMTMDERMYMFNKY